MLVRYLLEIPEFFSVGANFAFSFQKYVILTVLAISYDYFIVVFKFCLFFLFHFFPAHFANENGNAYSYRSRFLTSVLPTLN